MSDFNHLFDDIIDRLGGRDALASLLDVGMPALSNYRARGHIPASKQPIIDRALAAKGWQIDQSRAVLVPLIGGRKQILMIITGGIAAYKALETARRLMDRGYQLRIVMTKGAEAFITPLSAAALTGEQVYTELFSLTDEAEMGHIRLAREADLVLIVPATAHFIAKMAHGLADDLASTICLATTAPIMLAPAMNPAMWAHPATQENLAVLERRSSHIITPAVGDTACGEIGAGRLAEPMEIVSEADQLLTNSHKLKGCKVLVTSGPTFEPIDPVRFLGNRSSGKQGHAIASELAARGAEVTLVTGPVSLPDPANVTSIHIQTAEQMYQASMAALPCDIAICAAAVADWRIKDPLPHKTKKTADNASQPPPRFELVENPDILKSISLSEQRPGLVIGFAAETDNLLDYAREKRARKGCDWIIANQVGGTGEKAVFGADENEAIIITATGEHHLPRASKRWIARQIAEQISACFDHQPVKG